MGGWNSGRTGGQLTLEGCDSPAEHQEPARCPPVTNRRHRLALLPDRWRADARHARGPCRPRLPPPAASEPDQQRPRPHGLHRWSDLDRGRLRRPALVVQLPDLRARCATLYLPRGAQKFAAATTPAGLRRDPASPSFYDPDGGGEVDLGARCGCGAGAVFRLTPAALPAHTRRVTGPGRSKIETSPVTRPSMTMPGDGTRPPR